MTRKGSPRGSPGGLGSRPGDAGRRSYTAPGKLMIAGEYSVLGPGGSALAVAIQPGVDAEATPASRWQLSRSDLGVTWNEGEPVPAALHFAWTALLAARRCIGVTIPPHRITTWPEGVARNSGGKPGVGGSASATAVIVAAVFDLARLDPAGHGDQLLTAALDAHQEAQGGRGSGYDVATVIHGGLVSWRPGFREARKLPWPAGLAFLAGYSGSSARTTRQLGKLETLHREDDAGVDAELAALDVEVLALGEAFHRAHLSDILDGVRICHRALSAWDRRCGLGIVTPAIQRMVAMAEAAGSAAKVSGAGAGDSVIAFSDDEERLRALARAWRDEGFEPLGLALSPEGVRRTWR